MPKPLVIIAGGPSLTKEDVKYVEQQKVDIMGINDAYRICKRLTYLYACDRRWWNWHWTRINELPCRKFALEDMEGRYGIIQMQNDGFEGLSFEWPKLKTGKNSGYQAINLAILLKYTKVILLGYDMQYDAKGNVHWFGKHPNPLRNAREGKIKDWIRFYNEMAKLIPQNVKVYNASRDTALTCFARIRINEIERHI